MSENLPGKGFMGWLGRQIGHVKKAVKADVATKKIIHRQQTTQQAPHPEHPNLTLKRTIIDEVILDKDKPIDHDPPR